MRMVTPVDATYYFDNNSLLFEMIAGVFKPIFLRQSLLAFWMQNLKVEL